MGKKYKRTTAGFPKELYNILTEKSSKGIIDFNKKDSTIVINDIAKFEKEIMPFHFKQSKYSAFVRQLNNYGLYILNTMPKGKKSQEIYYHSKLKEKLNLEEIQKLKRLSGEKSKGIRKKKLANSERINAENNDDNIETYENLIENEELDTNNLKTTLLFILKRLKDKDKRDKEINELKDERYKMQTELNDYLKTINKLRDEKDKITNENELTQINNNFDRIKSINQNENNKEVLISSQFYNNNNNDDKEKGNIFQKNQNNYQNNLSIYNSNIINNNSFNNSNIILNEDKIGKEEFLIEFAYGRDFQNSSYIFKDNKSN